MRYSAAMLILLANAAWGSSYSIGRFGIDSQVTMLDGSGIVIGQVEIERSAKAGFDSIANSASNTIPAQVYFKTGIDSPNMHIHSHATRVAGVMIGKTTVGAIYEGVAPNANLHSAGFGGGDDSDAAITLNRVATVAGGTVRAINMSFGREAQEIIEQMDGDAHLTQFVDWSARRHNVLYVAAWPNSTDNPERLIPTDNFNGITVAASEESDPLFGTAGFDRFATTNWLPDAGDATGDRTSIDLLAPGTNVATLGPSDTPALSTGGSIAAPHATGATALLQQYALNQITASNPRFIPNSQRHEVMKAVMLNSADKLEGVHGSHRTILDSADQDWTQSEAFNTQFQSLDDEMGAGHLNVRRAVGQFASGEYDPGPVPLIGWDYDSIDLGQRNEYVFDQPLGGDQYIAVTLTWDRRVELTDPDNTYSFGDQFFQYNNVDDILNNLDVYLMDADETELGLSWWTSQTFEDNVEHIFFKNFPAGQYKIVVNHRGGIGDIQDYAIAWWFGSNLPGDYNSDGRVSAADYTVWRDNLGGPSLTNRDPANVGPVGFHDYNTWLNNYGTGFGSGAGASSTTAAVPEPGGVVLALLAGIVAAVRSRTCRLS